MTQSKSSLPATETTDGWEAYRGVVMPWHCDAMGHMSVQHQMPLLDGAAYHLLGRLGPIVDHADGRRLGWADVNHSIDYQHELVSGDLVVLRSCILTLGRTSLRHRTTLSRTDGRACTILTGVTVRFDLDTRQAVSLTNEIRCLAQALMISDHNSAPVSPAPTVTGDTI